MDQPARILVAGLGKSGTTALYFTIKNSMPATVKGVFEPRKFSAIEEISGNHVPLITKVLTPLPADFLPHLNDFFTHRVMIVRDPRDVVVSSLLYNTAYTYLWRYSTEQIKHSLALLRRKETDSTAISLLNLLAMLRDDFTPAAFAAFVSAMLAAVIDLADAPFRFFVLPYETMIAGHLEELEKHLGFPLAGTREVDPEFRRVERTRSSGNWRDWFLPEDVAYFRPLFDTFLRRFGYDADDWTPSDHRTILPSHCSEYALRVMNERRIGENLPPVLT